jgi:hypothetical protein
MVVAAHSAAAVHLAVAVDSAAAAGSAAGADRAITQKGPERFRGLSQKLSEAPINNAR